MSEVDEGTVGAAIGCLVVLLWLSWWGAVIAVAVHFIRKFW